MADSKERTVSYRRAVWVIDEPESINLGSMVKQALARLRTVEDRTIERANGQLTKLLKVRGYDEGHFLHITVETPGESASVVPTVSRVEETDVDTTQPPAGTEFMDGDAFLYVKRDHVTLCSTGLQDASIREFLISLFQKAKLRKDAGQFDLAKIADISKLKLLASQGVEEIEMRAATYWATAHYLKRKHQPQGMLGEMAKLMRTWLGKTNDVNQDAINVMLSFKVDRRRRGGIVLGERRLKEIGAGILKSAEAGDDFTIVTKLGQRIGPNEIFMRSTVRIEALGKSVVCEKAWKEVRRFYDVLSENGALES